MKKTLNDFRKLEKTKTEIEFLKALEEILKNMLNVNFTYKKKPDEEYAWDIYMNGTYFYTVSTPIVKILEIITDVAERAYTQGELNTINRMIKAIKK